MRKQEEKLVVTFHTTADAIALEKACKDAGVPGRMIPVPRELSAGCGLAWCTEPEREKELQHLFQENGLEWEGFTHMLY
jgi:hypothetical protein